MSPPIRDGSGSSIGSIRLGDGSEISEVRTGAGDVVFSAGPPDSAIAQYNAQELTLSDGENLTSWTDVVDGQDVLSNGTEPTFNASGINGYPSVTFDSDPMSTAYTSDYTPRFVVITVSKLGESASGSHNVMGGDSNRLQIAEEIGSDTYKLDAGSSSITAGNPDTNPTLITSIFDGPNSAIRVNGTEIVSASSDIGSSQLDGIEIGGAGHLSSGDYIGDIGFVEPHDGNPSNGLSTRETEVADMWDITL